MKIKLFLFYVSLLWMVSGCNPEFLDVKPQKSLVVPTSLSDMQALLDNAFNVMNQSGYLTLYADGDFRTNAQGLESEYIVIKNTYLWSKDIYQQGVAVSDWDQPYQQMFYANVILEGLGKIVSSDLDAVDFIKGQCLFYRGLALYNISQQFAAPYQQQSAATTAGAVIRLDSELRSKRSRASLEDTYQQILNDLIQAQMLLPESSSPVTRPSKPATLALLSRTYLAMGDYENAEKTARESLVFNDKLLDYNELDTAAVTPFTNPLLKQNPEILFYSLANTPLVSSNIYMIDSLLQKSYGPGDLRANLFHDKSGSYKGSYTGQYFCFTGLATDELYLSVAECLARKGQVDAALEMLSKLLIKRYNKGRLPVLAGSDPKQTLDLILAERRKQLVARGTRWTDLRRLNLDPALSVELRRSYQGSDYKLVPNDKRYLFAIPDDEIQRSGIAQNPR